MGLLTLSQDGKSGELLVYDDIGENWYGDGVSAKNVHQELKEAGGALELLTVRINSYGGVVTDGNAIYNALVRHKARVVVEIDGLAASAASVIAMAGDEINIAKNAMVMIHEASGMTFGDAEEHEGTARILRKMSDAAADIYVARTGQKKADVLKWMSDETWFSADEALERGFASKVTAAKEPPKAHTSQAVVMAYKHVPAQFQAQLSALKAQGPRSAPHATASEREALQPALPKTTRATSAQTQARRPRPSALAQLAQQGRARIGR